MADFLTPDQYDKYLTDALITDTLERKIDQFERTILDRYRRPVRVGTYSRVRYSYNDEDDKKLSRLSFRGSGDIGSDVLLLGYEEDDTGTPDIAAMDDELVNRIREVVARMLEEDAAQPSRHVQSHSQGSRSVTYRDRGMPASVYAPLKQYDLRTPLM